MTVVRSKCFFDGSTGSIRFQAHFNLAQAQNLAGLKRRSR